MAKTYDVFVSFRGADVRYTFLGHLEAAFKKEDIKAFVDKDLERGEEIASSLLAKIEDSYVSVVIFSENYAFSTWCLEELVKIVECKNNMGQVVIPVFYRVDPTDVQELSGNFGAAISEHRNEFKGCLDKVETWSRALKEIAELSGFVSDPKKYDSELIDVIINHTSEKLLCLDHHSNSDNYEGLIGIDHRINRVESLLCRSSSKVKIIGIWGMGGIGKSTLAKKVYDRIKSEFKSQCFVENVRERIENGELKSVRNEILCAIFGPTIANRANCTMLSPDIVRRLGRRNVCIILDDVSDITQIENSIGKLDIFGYGSVVIITSRDKHLLRLVNAETYEVEALGCNEALHLFCLHAFKQSTPKQEHEALVQRAAEYAQGNPLALKVLGSNLYSRNVEEWEDELEKLDGMPDETIGKILRISYDRLKKIEKEIFLFIACFFNEGDKDRVVRMLDMAGWKIGISSLSDRSLISITENRLRMHDLLQQMGKDITCEENVLGKRMILWRHKDICEVLINDEGTEAIKGISLDMSKIRDIELKSTTFGRLRNLRFLKFHNSSCPGFNSKNKVHVLGGVTCLPPELRLLQWDGCPLKSFASNSFVENLVELHMPHSELEELWSGTQQLGNLKLIDLSRSDMLRRLPDFSKAPKVEILNLKCCRNIRNLPENLGNLKSLLQLSLSNTAIEELPQSICNMERLKFLEAYNCRYLHKLPNNLGKLKSLQYLEIGGNDFESIPETIKQLSKLETLDLKDCKRLQYLPELPLLDYLNLEGCTSLKSVFGSSQLLHKQRKLHGLDLSDCLNLSEEECNFIADYAISSGSCKDGPTFKGWNIPGSEVPRKMKYKNESGSSVSFFLAYKQLDVQCLSLSLPCCNCVVLDPKLSSPEGSIISEVIIADELGHEFHDSRSYSRYRGTHVLKSLVKCYRGIGGACTVQFNFSNFEGCDGIIGCGVNPIRGNPVFEDNNDDSTEEKDEEEDNNHDRTEVEDEEEQPLKKLKHS